MKYLLLIGLVFLGLWILRRMQASGSGVQKPPVSRASERMVKCAYCGVNQPVSESVMTKGRYYCCVSHRHEAESQDN